MQHLPSFPTCFIFIHMSKVPDGLYSASAVTAGKVSLGFLFAVGVPHGIDLRAHQLLDSPNPLDCHIWTFASPALSSSSSQCLYIPVPAQSSSCRSRDRDVPLSAVCVCVRPSLHASVVQTTPLSAMISHSSLQPLGM